MRVVTSLALAFGLIGLYLATHRYYGILHDAELYTVQALRRLYPALSGDTFFLYGSQDSYTLFSSAYAFLISHFGIEGPAWVLTRLFAVFLFSAALLLARRLMDARLAWLAFGLFVLLPGKYGAGDVFRYGEAFLTPRPLAEAMVLLAVWLALGANVRLAIITSVAALFVHPLMAAPGVLLIFALSNPTRAPIRVGVPVVAGFILAVFVACVFPVGPLAMMDAQWQSALKNLTPYLSPAGWSILDWQRPVIPLSVLGIGVIVLKDSLARMLAASALAIGAAGIVFTVLGEYLAPIVLMLQGQPWRWTWISKAVAVLITAPIGAALWDRGRNGRAILALVAVAWYTAEEALGTQAALCALCAAMFEYRSRRKWRHLWIWAWAAAIGVAAANLVLTGVTELLVRSTALMAAWWAIFGPQRRWLAPITACGLSVFFARQVESAISGPRVVDYDQLAGELAPWGRRMWPEATVMFSSNRSLPWLALHRRTYLGNVGILFSRQAAEIVDHRVSTVEAVLKEHGEDVPDFFGMRPIPGPPISASTLRALCRLPDVDFIVTHEPYPTPHEIAQLGPPIGIIYLNDCGHRPTGRPNE